MSYEMKQKAIQHYNLMNKTYSKEINKCIKNSKIYDINYKGIKHIANENIDFKILNMSSTEAINHAAAAEKVCVLNFASYKNPGGGFMTGAISQEECLCHDSFLFNVLINFKDYYIWNRQNLNKGLYLNRAIYSPKIYFSKINRYADVLTCAAPNYSLSRFGTFTDKENYKELYNRIEFVLNIAEENKVDTLILGAFGCGVFRQDPYEVSNIFIKECKKRNFKNVIFPIIDFGYNYDAFKEALDNAN